MGVHLRSQSDSAVFTTGTGSLKIYREKLAGNSSGHLGRSERPTPKTFEPELVAAQFSNPGLLMSGRNLQH